MLYMHATQQAEELPLFAVVLVMQLGLRCMLEITAGMRYN
jgi:hypothetical protein